MKKTLHSLFVAVIAFTVVFTSCKKADTNSIIDSSSELTTHSDDQARFDNEADAIDNDANISIENFTDFQGKVENVLGNVCNADVVYDSTATDKRITITYNGANCIGTRTRTGIVVITMPLAQHWADVGAVVTVTTQNLKITRIVDNKSITINGVHTITNVSGGRLINLSIPGTTIIHDISSSGMTVTFDNNTQRSWQVAKRRTFSYNGGIVITTVGTHTDGNTTGISVWGTNRFGNSFTTSITQPMVIRQDCQYRLVSGEVTHNRLVANVVVTFGLDATGAPTSCPAGVYYFKLVWTGTNGIVRTIIQPY